MSLLINTLKLSKQNSVIRNAIPLTENWTGKTLHENDICAYHRYTSRTCWSQPRIYSHPLLQLVGKGKKGSVSCTAPEETWKVICSQHPNLYFPFGSCWCYQHLKIHKTASVLGEHATGVSDDDYEPEEIYILNMISLKVQDVLLKTMLWNKFNFTVKEKKG